jgi:hypothetical protein
VKAFIACALVGVVAAALVPFVHPWVHEGEAFAASLAGLLLASLSARLVKTRAELAAEARRSRHLRRIRELAG